MGPELVEQLEYLNTRIDQMIERVREMPSDQQRMPVGKSFAPIQALEHMAVTEQIYIDIVKKTDPATLKGRKGKPNFLYGLVLKTLNKPAKVASFSPKPFLPKDDLSVDESAAKWKDLRGQLLDYLRPFGDDDAAIKHPLFGYMSPYDLFILLEKHQDYHDARLQAGPG